MYTEPDSEEEEEDGEFLEDAENLENEVPDMMSSTEEDLPALLGSITSSLYILRIFDEPEGSSVPGFEYPVASDMELD